MMASHKALPNGMWFALWITFSPFLGFAQAPSPTQDKQSGERKIQEILAAPPLFLDESHPGPAMAPTGMPKTIFPFDCRAVEAYLHRVRPGQYHFERAQRLLGQGIDVIRCEAFGLDRFTEIGDDSLRLGQAVREAESAAALPIGLDQWRPGAANDVLASAYKEAAAGFDRQGKKNRSAEELEQSHNFRLMLQALSAAPTLPSHVDRGPLTQAVLNGDNNAVAALISSGSDVNSVDTDHTSALRLAVVAGSPSTVQLLLSWGAKPDIADEEGVTALMDACSTGRFEIAFALIERGSRVNATANDESSPLLDAVGHIALGAKRADKRDFVQMLVARGANVNQADWFGTTPLILAAKSGDVNLTDLLLGAVAAINASDHDGNTALIHAVKNDAVVEVATLLGNKPKLEVFNRRGESPLILAAKNGYSEGQRIFHLLLGAGADPNGVSSGAWTPLMSAERFDYRKPWGVSSHAIVDELLGRHVDVNARSKEGTTALLVAAQHAGPDDDSFVKQLVEAGANVNAADNDGGTPLMAAAELGHVAKVRFLLAHGARANARDNMGRTALDYGRRPRNENDDEFPQRYDSIDSSRRKTNDCKATRNALRSPARDGWKQ